MSQHRLDIDFNDTGYYMDDNMSATRVQVSKPEKSDRVWMSVSGPTDIGLEVERVVLDVAVSDVDYMDRIATYRNMLADVQEKRLIRRWSRKSLAESLIESGCSSLREQMSRMVADLGPLPPANDIKAVEQYVRRVIAWDKRQ